MRTAWRWGALAPIAMAALVLASTVIPAADKSSEFATLEVASRAGSAEVALVVAPNALRSLERESGSLQPSDSSPRWLLHFWAGAERLRSVAVVPADLERNPAIASAVTQLEDGAKWFVYSVTLPATDVERSELVVERLQKAGFRPLFHRGERSNWPYVEVLLSETAQRETDRAGTTEPGPEIDPEGLRTFAERLGPLLRSHARDSTVEPLYRRLESRLYRHYRALSSNTALREFYATYRRYRRRGNDGTPKASVLARYAARTRSEMDALMTYLASVDAERVERHSPGGYTIEVLCDVADPAQVQASLTALFPDLRRVRPGRRPN